MTDYTKPNEKQTIVLGKNKTKVSMHSPKKDIHKETILQNITRLVLETKADRVGQAYTKADYDKCYSAPRFVLADPNSPASLADLAYRVIMVSNEDYVVEDYLEEKTNRGNTYRAAGATADDVVRHKQFVQGGKDMVAKSPANHQNIVDHYNRANHAEKQFGHDWYQDAHHLTKAVAQYTKTPMHTAAGLVGNYSPQQDWAANIHTASRVMRTKTAMGGKGGGIMASGAQKTAAQRMLNGEHHTNILKGNKIRSFTHLIEHGGNADPNVPHVVIDRHAAAVAHGGRLTEAAYKHGLGGLSSKSKYHEYEQHYHNAAKAINAANPGATPVHAHQVQATTWLVRQRENQGEEQAKSKKGTSGTAKRVERNAKDWDSFRTTHFPNIGDTRKMSGYSTE